MSKGRNRVDLPLLARSRCAGAGAKVQIGAELLCKGGKVNKNRKGAGQDRLQSAEYGLRREGRGQRGMGAVQRCKVKYQNR